MDLIKILCVVFVIKRRDFQNLSQIYRDTKEREKTISTRPFRTVVRPQNMTNTPNVADQKKNNTDDRFFWGNREKFTPHSFPVSIPTTSIPTLPYSTTTKGSISSKSRH
ncbi:hypothetical protein YASMINEVIRUS_983 [Yasminevirus sp. GU-2018]|uniref:Uncharacterized protein n=1 Tax=Yasminevirus sp. GU-2018 TaxID=2420051 RepID=A0A5K0U9Z8_9VIRU|nr:hypothetical protein YASMINEVIRUS_983 [Yasminevirus sp. GU-2018]